MPERTASLIHCNVTRYFVDGVTVWVRGDRPRFGGLVRGITTWRWPSSPRFLPPCTRLSREPPG